MVNEESELPSFMQRQIKDIQFIQERYAWFLDRVFANAVFEVWSRKTETPRDAALKEYGRARSAGALWMRSYKN